MVGYLFFKTSKTASLSLLVVFLVLTQPLLENSSFSPLQYSLASSEYRDIDDDVKTVPRYNLKSDINKESMSDLKADERPFSNNTTLDRLVQELNLKTEQDLHKPVNDESDLAIFHQKQLIPQQDLKKEFESLIANQQKWKNYADEEVERWRRMAKYGIFNFKVPRPRGPVTHPHLMSNQKLLKPPLSSSSHSQLAATTYNQSKQRPTRHRPRLSPSIGPFFSDMVRLILVNTPLRHAQTSKLLHAKKRFIVARDSSSHIKSTNNYTDSQLALPTSSRPPKGAAANSGSQTNHVQTQLDRLLNMLPGRLGPHPSDADERDSDNFNLDEIECKLYSFTYEALKRDDKGNHCRGLIKASVCAGGCQSGEYSDINPDTHRPVTRRIHEACLHDEVVSRKVRLADCRDANNKLLGAGNEALSYYHFTDAISCRCDTCQSSKQSCLNLKPL